MPSDRKGCGPADACEVEPAAIPSDRKSCGHADAVHAGAYARARPHAGISRHRLFYLKSDRAHGPLSPYKRHANKFNYIPRYFDPAKEAREERRAELRGERSEDAERPYAPGQYIRTQREARAARRTAEHDARNRSVWKLAAGAALILLFVSMLYPRLAEVFRRAQRTPAPVEQTVRPRTSAFDQDGISDVEWQAQPITIVPNDYREEE